MIDTASPSATGRDSGRNGTAESTGNGARGGRRERPRILVAEDDADDREIYGRMLAYNGFDVIFAADGETALRLARSRRPDLLLLDLGLPLLSGLDVCAELRRDAATAGLPIIALTAFARERMGQHARRAGCTTYIEKPVSPVSVLHAVESLIGKAPLPGVGSPPTVTE
ncbi:MAG TPA: response regulator [Longimicrobiales bacterium]|nr:response regulator [Longimicrobiales bacterium]